MAANYLQREFISHTRRVCSLYKRMLMDLRYQETDFLEIRYKSLLVRQEFDKNKNIKDMRKAKALLEKAEQEFRNNIHPVHEHGQPWHPFSKEGIAHGRNLESPDYVMDYYHPLEKAQYPYYFAKREAMKDEYIRVWKKKTMKKIDEEDSTSDQRHH